MQIPAPPSGVDLDALLARLAYRHPEPCSVTVTGDGDKQVRLPILLGNHSGACKLPSGEHASPIWGAIVSGKAPDDMAHQAALDCVLWPDRATWAQWCERWPILPETVAELATQRIDGAVEKPFETDEAPPEIAAAVVANPRRVWRIVKARDEEFAVVLEPPDREAHDIYRAALEEPDADSWAVLCGYLAARVVACERLTAGARLPFAEVVARWPGVAPRLVREINRLAGARANVQLGKF